MPYLFINLDNDIWEEDTFNQGHLVDVDEGALDIIRWEDGRFQRVEVTQIADSSAYEVAEWKNFDE